MKIKGGRREREVKRLKVTKVGKVTGVIEIDIVKTKCMITYRDQNARLSRNIEIGNGYFESVE
jgi:flagellar hook assembly protein FlgD